jgi:hypothetical protein
LNLHCVTHLDRTNTQYNAMLMAESLPVRATISPSPHDRRGTLDASVLDRTSRGINAVRAYFVAASSLYSSLRFTNETVTGARTFLEWEGKAFGEEVAGITVFVRNKSGRIAKIRLYTSPLTAVHQFATALQKHLPAKSGKEYGR